MTDNRACVIVAPGAGAALELGLGRPTIKIGPPLSTQIGLLESELPPGGGFRVPHWHEDLDEGFYVLDGEIDYLLETQWRRAPAGELAGHPRGQWEQVHARRRSHYAHSRPGGPRAEHAAAGGPATAPGRAGAT